MQADTVLHRAGRAIRSAARIPSGGCTTALIGFLVLTAIAAGLCYTLDALFVAPWAYPLPGQPPLTGTWEGLVSMPSGVQLALFLDLHRPLLAAGSPHSGDYQGAMLSGKASWCDSRGRIAANIPIDGAIPNFTGSHGSAARVDIGLESASHPQPGLLPSVFQGSWHGDTLTLRATFASWNGKTFEYSANDPDLNSPSTVVLKRVGAGAFPAACNTLHAMP